MAWTNAARFAKFSVDSVSGTSGLFHDAVATLPGEVVESDGGAQRCSGIRDRTCSRWPSVPESLAPEISLGREEAFCLDYMR